MRWRTRFGGRHRALLDRHRLNFAGTSVLSHTRTRPMPRTGLQLACLCMESLLVSALLDRSVLRLSSVAIFSLVFHSFLPPPPSSFSSFDLLPSVASRLHHHVAVSTDVLTCVHHVRSPSCFTSIHERDTRSSPHTHQDRRRNSPPALGEETPSVLVEVSVEAMG